MIYTLFANSDNESKLEENSFKVDGIVDSSDHNRYYLITFSDVNIIWDFSLYCECDLEHIHRYFGKNEWNKMFDAWVYFCFKIDGFEIFLTETKGLGIKK